MSDCEHRWIGDTCVECGVGWYVYAESKIESLQGERCDLLDRIKVLEGEVNTLKKERYRTQILLNEIKSTGLLRTDSTRNMYKELCFLLGVEDPFADKLNHPTKE